MIFFEPHGSRRRLKMPENASSSHILDLQPLQSLKNRGQIETKSMAKSSARFDGTAWSATALMLLVLALSSTSSSTHARKISVGAWTPPARQRSFWERGGWNLDATPSISAVCDPDLRGAQGGACNAAPACRLSHSSYCTNPHTTTKSSFGSSLPLVSP